MSAEQERALAVYTDPRFLAENARWAGHLASDGAALARDLAVGKLGAVPTVVVSAGERSPKSAIRRTHEPAGRMDPGCGAAGVGRHRHPLHLQQPGKVTEAVLALLERAWDIGANGDPGRITC
jgi:hypothetical protein